MTNPNIATVVAGSVKEEWISFIKDLQDKICAAVESSDGKAQFEEEHWERPGGGGGRTRVIKDGAVFEKGGVNISFVYGKTTPQMAKQLPIECDNWFAGGLSLVLHPENPFVPTTHLNYRLFEMYDKEGNVLQRRFGGGTDLTPYYLEEEDVQYFHRQYKSYCDKSDRTLYPKYKKACDEYFANHHRNNENRGVGGIFYDLEIPDAEHDTDFWIQLAKDCGYGFIDAYIPLVEKHKKDTYTEAQKRWQEIRRGRYVEFNLLWDKGTLFGLRSNGRTESILMSLPPTVRFEYNYHPESGTPEAALEAVCQHPKEWA